MNAFTRLSYRLVRVFQPIAVALVVGTAPAAAQLVDLATSPLYGGRQPHPNVAVTTSVEFPTVGAAYLNVSYNRNSVYLGYFDPTRCYDYRTDSGGYFAPGVLANVTTHECSSQFSGNFMNWATMSAIDEFRYAMTGGNRDNENGPNQGTIIQRAYLPDGSIGGVPDFYALGSNFPRHVLQNGQIDGVASSLASAVLPTGSVSAFANLVPIYVTNCKTQIYFGSQPDGNCGGPRNDYGTYNVRVLVCDNTEGPTRSDLCQQYGGNTGRYKPVGEAQKNADRMRFSVFGYLMDHDTPGYNAPCSDSGWNRCRYGGVMRAPMKYLGPLKYDANQISSNNGASEVNADGTFNRDPEQTAIVSNGNSGFINYINKFGATGVYKRLDPMGELYYEAIRYFQNLGPTPLATANLPGGAAYIAVLDNFPIVTTWTDPILSTCSANYIINLSDANTWDDTYLPGFNGRPNAGYGRPGSRPTDGGLDAYAWTAKIASLESTTPSVTPGDVRPNLNNIQNSNVANNASWLAAGAAFWANVNDIRPDLTGRQTIKTISFDVAEASIEIRDRQLYLMGKYGGYTDNTTDASSVTYGNPFLTLDADNPAGLRTNFEWEDAVGSAYPTNYLLASDPQKLITGLRAAFARITADTGTLSGAALTSANLTYGTAGAYIAAFDPRKWSGSVLRKSLSVVSGNLVVSPTATWNAGTLLTTRCGAVLSGQTTCQDTDTSLTRRNIVTTITSSGVRTATNFTWANLASDSAYVTALKTNPATNTIPANATTADTEGRARLNYLRGFRGDEASALTFRSRDSALGDVVNSGPVFEGPPSSGISDAGYETFYRTNLNRAPAVYFGANDGMLHAIDAESGQELFAYIPGFVGPTLNVLTNPGYLHEAFVDAVPSVQEALVNGAWKTVLVSGVGNGAQGVFALDVTNPATFAPTNVLFEFSDADDADLGNVMTSPEIVKVQTGVSAGIPTYGYFAVVTAYGNRRTTNGSRTDSRVSTDSSNRGALFFLSLNRQLNTPWTLGSNYYKFYFPASNPSQANGLGPVSQFKSRGGSGSAAALYFGDVQGNLWRFNTTGNDPSTWLPARGTVASPLPIFTATNATGTVRQPIVARPEVATGPYGTTMVFFGTGKYYGPSDLAPPFAQQSEYALIDNGSTTPIVRNADLALRTVTLSGNNVTVAGTPFTYSGPSSKKGWVLDFASSVSTGERSVTKPAVANGLLTFTTLTLAADICGAGNGYIYQLNALSGLPFLSSPNGNTGGYSSTVGIPGPPRVVDLVLASGLGRATGEQINQRVQTTLVSGTTSKIDASGIVKSKASPVGRINWRELTNYNDR